jgi:hypothetical protein
VTTLFSELPVESAKPVLPIITQITEAWKNKAAFLAGLPFGAITPAAIFYGVHFEVRPLLMRVLTDPGAAWYDLALLAILGLAVAGGLWVSAKTVYRWGQAGFRDGGQPDNGKALGTVLLLEVWMTFASNIWFSAVLLVFLVVINGLATACNFALNAKYDKPKPSKRR